MSILCFFTKIILYVSVLYTYKMFNKLAVYELRLNNF